ncbi:hypothetical protein HK104_007916, partial [Borealophlyctis nickersoniae]
WRNIRLSGEEAVGPDGGVRGDVEDDMVAVHMPVMIRDGGGLMGIGADDGYCEE